MDIYDRALKRMDVARLLGYTPRQAGKLMEEFGLVVGKGNRERIIRQSELRLLQLDGTIAEWASKHLRLEDDEQ